MIKFILFLAVSMIVPTDGMKVADKPQFVNCSEECTISVGDGLMHVVSSGPVEIWETHEVQWHGK